MKTSERIGAIALACGAVSGIVLWLVGAAAWICVVGAIAVFGLIDYAARKNAALDNLANLSDHNRR